jgi:hypothetical protein
LHGDRNGGRRLVEGLEEGNMVKRIVLVVLAAMLITLVIAGTALAATPEDIYKDFVDHNGTLTGTYTHEELNAFLNYGPYIAYPPEGYKDLTKLITEMLEEKTTVFPFTGFQLMIAGIVAVALIGGGVALRRFARSS